MNEHVSTGHMYGKASVGSKRSKNTKQGPKQAHICAAWALKTTIRILEGVTYFQLLALQLTSSRISLHLLYKWLVLSAWHSANGKRKINNFGKKYEILFCYRSLSYSKKKRKVQFTVLNTYGISFIYIYIFLFGGDIF